MDARRRVGRGIVVLASAVLALTACTKTLNTDKLETTLQRDIAERTHTTVKSVSCPSDVNVQKGASFTCTLTAGDGSTHHVKITQTDDQGHVHYEVTD